MKKGLYIHLPFCTSKCWYCDFYSKPFDLDEAAAYVEAVEREAAIRFSRVPWSDDAVPPVWNTAYIGGGTPSVLPMELLKRIISIPQVMPGGEYTIEANPEQVDDRWLNEVAIAGINRVSMGVQSFNTCQLDAVGRHYEPGKTMKAIEALVRSGLDFSLDLIYGLPGQTPVMWRDELRRLLEIHPPHFSAYLLSFEPGTRLYARLVAGKVDEVSEEIASEMYSILCDEARDAGYNHYEVSNFALPGKTAIHNSSYWSGVPYLGLGASAHSFDGQDRANNESSISQYISKLQSDILPLVIENETELDRLNDKIITGLRTADGFLLPAGAPANLLKSIDFHLSLGNLYYTPHHHLAIPETLWLKSDAIMRDLIQV